MSARGSAKGECVIADEDIVLPEGGILTCKLPRSRLYKCAICEASFLVISAGRERDNSTRKHLLQAHGLCCEEVAFECRFCDFKPPVSTGRPAADAVRKHLSQVHPEVTREPPRQLGFMCKDSDCQQRFPTTAALRSHEKKHNKEKLDSVEAQLKALTATRHPRTVKPLEPTASSTRPTPTPEKQVCTPQSKSTSPLFRLSGKTYAEAVSPKASRSTTVTKHASPAEVVISDDDEADLLLIKDGITSELLGRLFDRRQWIDDCVILELLKRRVVRGSSDFIVVDPVVWHDKYQTPTTWTAASGRSIRGNLPTYPSFSDTWKTALVPTHINGVHWVLAVVFNRPAKVVYYDTLHKKASQSTMLKWATIAKLLTRKTLTPGAVDCTSYPRQIDNDSCGPLVCMLAEKIAKGESTLFDPKSVYEWREQAARYLSRELGIPLPPAVNSAHPAAKEKVVSPKGPQNDQPRRSLIPVLIAKVAKDGSPKNAKVARIPAPIAKVAKDGSPKASKSPQRPAPAVVVEIWSSKTSSTCNQEMNANSEVGKKVPSATKKDPEAQKDSPKPATKGGEQTKVKDYISELSKFSLTAWTVAQVDAWRVRNGKWDEFEQICTGFTTLGKLLLKGKAEQASKAADKIVETLTSVETALPAHLRTIGTQTSSAWRKNGAKRRMPLAKKTEKTPVHRLFYTNRRAAMDKVMGDPRINCPIPIPKLEKFFQDAATPKSIDLERLEELISQIEKNEKVPDSAWINVQPEDVTKLLSSAPKTSPGADQVSYADLKRLDPTGRALACLYNVCFEERQVPKHWKESTSILIFKKGDEADPSNWRPIALQLTIYKVFSSIRSARISQIPGVVSWHQKGFVQRNGCAENIALVTEAVAQAKAKRSTVAMAFLDLGNAFGSAAHELMFRMMDHLGVPDRLIDVCKNIYADSTVIVKTELGITNSIPLKAGVKQGDPASPGDFNIALELLIRITEKVCSKFGVKLPGIFVNLLAFADDLVVICESQKQLEMELDLLQTVSQQIGLTFKPSKCAALLIKSGLAVTDQDNIRFGDDVMRILKPNEQYEYLGRSVGYERRSNPRALIFDCAVSAYKIADSELLPHQKLDAIRTNVLPRVSYICQNGLPYISELAKLDDVICRATKSICRLPQTATRDLIYGPIAKGGLGMVEVKHEYYINTICAVLKGLCNVDPVMKDFALAKLQDTVQRFTRKPPTVDSVNQFLASVKEGDLHWTNREGSAVCSAETRYRMAIDHCVKRGLTIKAEFDENWVLNVNVSSPDIGSDRNFDTATIRGLYSHLRWLSSETHLHRLVFELKSQGFRYTDVAQSNLSNKFVQDGRFCSPKAFRFVHRARLGLLPLGATPMGKGLNIPVLCRRCKSAPETLAHVLGTCTKNNGLINVRHNNVLELVQKAAGRQKDTKARLQIEPTIKTASGNFRPDLLYTTETEVHVIDVTCPIEGGQNMVDSRKDKLQKYEILKQHLEQQGKKATVETIVIGMLGAWDAENFNTLTALDIPRHRQVTLARRTIEASIEGSRRIYATHVMKA